VVERARPIPGDGSRFRSAAGRQVVDARHAADGQPFIVKGEYRIVQRPSLLEFTWLPDWQDDATESVVRLELEETHGVTHVRLIHSGLTTATSRSSHRGWPQILGLLKSYVEVR
jgi:uncharacterized protein YndB with AHSA1/START domain